MQRVVAYVRDGRILARTGPGNFVNGCVKLLRDAQRVGLIADDLPRQQAYRLIEYDVRRTLRYVRSECWRNFYRRDPVRIKIVVLGEDGKFVAHREAGWLSRF